MNWNELIADIVYAVVVVLGAMLFPKISQLLAAQAGNANALLLTNLAAQVVRSVEQQLEGAPGNEKKAVAVAALKGLTESHNLKITEANLHAAIEAAVYSLPKWLETSFGSVASIGSEDVTSAPAPAPAVADAQSAIVPFTPPPAA